MTDRNSTFKQAKDVALDALTDITGVFRCRCCEERIVKDENEPCPECQVIQAEHLQDALTGR